MGTRCFSWCDDVRDLGGVDSRVPQGHFKAHCHSAFCSRLYGHGSALDGTVKWTPAKCGSDSLRDWSTCVLRAGGQVPPNSTKGSDLDASKTHKDSCAKSVSRCVPWSRPR